MGGGGKPALVESDDDGDDDDDVDDAEPTGIAVDPQNPFGDVIKRLPKSTACSFEPLCQCSAAERQFPVLIFVNWTSRLCNYRIIADELSVRTVPRYSRGVGEESVRR